MVWSHQPSLKSASNFFFCEDLNLVALDANTKKDNKAAIKLKLLTESKNPTMIPLCDEKKRQIEVYSQ